VNARDESAWRLDISSGQRNIYTSMTREGIVSVAFYGSARQSIKVRAKVREVASHPSKTLLVAATAAAVRAEGETLERKSRTYAWRRVVIPQGSWCSVCIPIAFRRPTRPSGDHHGSAFACAATGLMFCLDFPSSFRGWFFSLTCNNILITIRM